MGVLIFLFVVLAVLAGCCFDAGKRDPTFYILGGVAAALAVATLGLMMRLQRQPANPPK